MVLLDAVAPVRIDAPMFTRWLLFETPVGPSVTVMARPFWAFE
jgi:hypothetical protein